MARPREKGGLAKNRASQKKVSPPIPGTGEEKGGFCSRKGGATVGAGPNSMERFF